LYFSATPLGTGKEFTIKLAKVMEKKLNEYYDQMAQDLFFCKSHRLYIKGESVAETAIWIAKKRYAMNVVYDLESNLDVAKKMKVKGLDVVRSSFPPAFRDFMNGMMKDILGKMEKPEVDTKVLTFREELDNTPYIEVARNTSVKNISEYDVGGDLNKFEKGTPAHVKAALSYNEMLRRLKLDTRFEPIVDGEKIKWVYLKENPYKLEAIAMKGYNDPQEIVELVTEYIDYDLLFEKELQSKIQDFYSALRWGNLPTSVNQNAQEWFSF
jgi:DNA polymerase elongation subunit (family B)